MNESVATEPLVVSVVLNTNRRDDTLDCLESLGRGTYENCRVIVLDNHSADGSVSAIGSAFPAVRIIELHENRGYAGNNNVGIAAAIELKADWVFILNEDTILAADCLAHLIDIGRRDDRIGIVGPMVYHFNEPTLIQSAGGRLNDRWQGWHIARDEPDRNQVPVPHGVDWISGCAILVRRPVIEQVGMIDERFFYYWEETEWCLRARRCGWKIIQVPQAKLWHKGVQRDGQPRPSVTYYDTRNRLLMMAKHGAPTTVWMRAWLELLRTLTSWSIRPKWRAKIHHRNAMWWGMIDFLRHRWGRMPIR